MKRAFSLLLLCALCLGLCACKSTAVKNAESLIEALPAEITLEHIDAVQVAQDAYNALTPEEQQSVKNYQTLVGAADRACELQLMGDWCNTYIDFKDIEGMYSRVDFVLYEDMTFFMPSMGTENGTWLVSGDKLALSLDDGNYMLFTISKDGDTYTLTSGESHYLSATDFHGMLDKMFKVVELTGENVADYCELYLYTAEETDETGTPNGYSKTYAMLGSKAYADGWCCLGGKDIAIDVQIPEQQVTHSFLHDQIACGTKEAHVATVQFDIPFAEAVEEIAYINARGTYTSDLTAELLTFGQAKGKLYFVNLEHIAEITSVDNRNRSIALTTGDTLPYAIWNENLWNEEHPY